MPKIFLKYVISHTFYHLHLYYFLFIFFHHLQFYSQNFVEILRLDCFIGLGVSNTLGLGLGWSAASGVGSGVAVQCWSFILLKLFY